MSCFDAFKKFINRDLMSDDVESAIMFGSGFEAGRAEEIHNRDIILIEPSNEVKHFMHGCHGALEATNFEMLMLWKEHHESENNKIEQCNHLGGYLPCIARSNDRKNTIHLSLSIYLIRGKQILVFNPTSQFVDHLIIEQWLSKYLPHTAIRDGVANIKDAGSAFNLV